MHTLLEYMCHAGVEASDGSQTQHITNPIQRMCTSYAYAF